MYVKSYYLSIICSKLTNTVF